MLINNVLVVHRYLAVAVGLLMTLWCLSGFVMMYQDYPSLSVEERLRGLEPLDLRNCCELSSLPADITQQAPEFRVEMLNGNPVLRLGGGFGSRASGTPDTIDLRTGAPVAELSAEDVLKVAERYGQGAGLTGAARLLGIIDVDQWTLQSARRNQPAHHVALDDAAGTEIYINGSTGEVFQDTNRRERILTWLGAIPHWLYPTVLRQNGLLWSQVVIWTSVIGTFLAATGLYVGISRLTRRKADGAWASPFRGWWYWHHISGLLFGVLALTWVFSGLMTMNPWGALESRGGAVDLRSAITGSATWGEVREFLGSVGARLPPVPEFKQLEAIPFSGRLYALAKTTDGARLRLNASGVAVALTQAEVDAAVARIGIPIRTIELLEQEDSYYYGHKSDVDLPVYRAVLDDADATRVYISPETGRFRALDSNAKWSRWVRRGLHGLDFAGLRTRPIWDIVTLLLLAGVTVVCGTGAWMALKRVKFDYGRLRARVRRRHYESLPQTSRR